MGRRRLLFITELIAILLLIYSPSSKAADNILRPAINSYIIHLYDEIEISVYGNESLSKTAVVRPDGIISFPLVGDIYALGMTTGELRESIEKLLAPHVKAPIVTLLMTKFYKPQVYILGDISSPGGYPLPEDATNLIGLLASAKAFDDGVVYAKISLIRSGNISSIQVMSPPADFELLPDDVILVKPAKKESITIIGCVNTPGLYPYVEGQTLLDVITRAGGFSPDSAQNAITITRSYPNRPEIITVGDMNRRTGDVPAILPGDVVSVPKRKSSFTSFLVKKALPALRDIVIISRVLNK